MSEETDVSTEETESAVESNSEKKTGIKAKTVSLIGKVVGGVVILGGHIFKWLGKLPDASSKEIVCCGLAIMACFGTIDLNILIDKFTKKETDD